MTALVSGVFRILEMGQELNAEGARVDSKRRRRQEGSVRPLGVGCVEGHRGLCPLPRIFFQFSE